MKHLLSFKNENNKYTLNSEYLIYFNYLRVELNTTKSKIDEYYNEWEKIKKSIHDYEYVFYSSYRKKNISCITPVSRSYFKFREIYYEFNLDINEIQTICNLAEAPGGFIESIVDLSGKKILTIYANSLLSCDKSIPIWNNKINKYKINTLYGNKRGDLCDFNNLLSMIKKVGRNTCELVTGDGGFDYSSDYSNQEKNSLRLIYGEIFMALNLQKKKGNFICKIFDSFEIETIKLLYLLNLSYERVYFYKPKMSRNSNSEKYIVCLNYNGYNKDIVNMMCHCFPSCKLNITVNIDDNLLKFISDYTIQQIKSINNGIDIIKNNNYHNKPREKQIRLALKWCNKYNIKINDRCIYLNNPS